MFEEIKETTDTASSALFKTYTPNLAYKVISIANINFPHLSSNIRTSPAYGIYISQFIRYSRACSSYSDFVKRHQCLSRKLMNQGYVKERLVLFLKKFIGRYQDLVDKYSVSTSQIIHGGLDV